MLVEACPNRLQQEGKKTVFLLFRYRLLHIRLRSVQRVSLFSIIALRYTFMADLADELFNFQRLP